MIIINRKLKKRNLLNAYIYFIIISTRVREIKNNIYIINKYILYKNYLLNKKNKNKRIIIIKIILREIYLINKLVINILLKNNILISFKINLLCLKEII